MNAWEKVETMVNISPKQSITSALNLSLLVYLTYLLFFMQTNSSQTSKKKLNYLTIFFVNHCSLVRNNCVLPTDLPQLTNKCLDSTHFSSSDIAKLISHLDPYRAHGHDMLSIQMIKLCGK